MENNKVLLSIAYAVVALVYNLCIFLLIKERGGCFWSGYIFSMLAFVLQYGVVFYVWNKNSKMKDIFLGLPVLKDSLIYLIVQLIVGLIFMVFHGINIIFATVIQVVILAAFIVVVLSALFAKNTVSQIDEKVRAKRFYIQDMVIVIEGMQNRAEDVSLKKSLRELVETIKYSDPVSSEMLEKTENKIQCKVDELEMLFETGDVSEIQTRIREIDSLMVERNKKCKLLK